MIRYQDSNSSTVHQGLALLTLSWDKKWDSHSLVNGYPSFYPRIALVAPSLGNMPQCAARRLKTHDILLNAMTSIFLLASFIYVITRCVFY